MYKNKLYGINDCIDKLVELVQELCSCEICCYYNLNKLDDCGIDLINLQFEINNPHLDILEIQKLFKEIKSFDPDYQNSNDPIPWKESNNFKEWQHLLIKLEELLKVE